MIVIASFVIRYKGVWFGYPLPVHPDEPYIVNSVLNMLKTGDLNPHFFDYPSLVFYLQAMLFYAIAFWKQFFFDTPLSDIPEIDFYIYGRILIVLLSTATIYVTYEIGRRLIHPLVGLIAACFTGASYLHITNSFMITTDSPVAFWSSLAVLMAVLIYTKGGKRYYYVLAGIFAGLAMGSKYTAFISILPMVLAHLYIVREDRRWINTNIILGMLVVPITFLFTTPYAVLDFKTFRGDVGWIVYLYRTGRPGAESMTNTSFVLYANYLFSKGYGQLPLILSGCGLLWLLKKDFWRVLILLSFPLLLFIFVGQYKVFFPRNLVAVIPFLSLFSGIFIYAILEWFKQWVSGWLKPPWQIVGVYVFIVMLLLVSIYGQVVRAQQHVRNITLPDTRWVSIRWVEENLPPGSGIGREHYTPPIEKYTDQFQVVYLGYFALVSNPEKINSLDYMILSSFDYARFTDNPDKYPYEAQVYNTFFTRNTLVKEFVPDGERLGGPTIRIYALKK
jgi:4-amino-4-deoxy-L-arabinose transferase-like glycosyltransferase